MSELKIVKKAFVAKSNTNEFVVFDTGEIPGGVFMVNCQVVNGIDDSHIVIGCYLNKAHQWIAKTDRTPGITVGIAVKAIAFAYK